MYVYILIIFCAGTLALVGLKGWRKGLQYAMGLLLMEYIFLLYASTVIFRKAAEVRSYDFTPFWSYSKPELMVENIMNVVVFVPVGAIIGFMVQGSGFTVRGKWKNFRTRIARISLIVAAGLIISGSIEALQFFLKRGFSEEDDLMHNTVGCILGYMLVKGLWFMVKGFRQRRIAG